jgi:hypothetical protein
MPTPPFPGFLTQVGLAKETTWGTPIAPTTLDQFMPIMNPKPADEIDTIEDTGYRGLLGKTQGYYQGFRLGRWAWEMHAFPEPLGNIIMGLLGTDGWASASLHPFTALNSGLPPSYSIYDFYGVTGTNTRIQAGSYIESLALSGGVTGPLKATITTIGKSSPGTALAAKPTAVYTTAAPFLPWQGVVTLNSVANLKLIQFDLLLKRPIDMIMAAGSQDPSAGNSGSLEVTGKLSFVPSDETELALYLTAQQAAFPLNVTYTSGSNILNLNMAKINFEKATVLERTTPYVKLNASFRAIHNATDTGPIKITLTGGKTGSAY